MSIPRQPIDYRRESYEAILARIPRLGLEVWRALLAHGPCTTRELARRAGLDLLTVRPRVTELCQLGWVRLTDDESGGREGIYQALSEAEAREVFARRRADAVGTRVQAELRLP